MFVCLISEKRRERVSQATRPSSPGERGSVNLQGFFADSEGKTETLQTAWAGSVGLAFLKCGLRESLM